MESAVPQLPAPMMASRSTMRPLSENTFSDPLASAPYLAMPVDDKAPLTMAAAVTGSGDEKSARLPA